MTAMSNTPEQPERPAPDPPSTTQLPSANPTPAGLPASRASPPAIKPQRKDLALVFSSVPCNAAGVFTVNKARAAPVIDCVARLPAAGIRAVVINSGNANALTGRRRARGRQPRVCAEVARGLLVSPSAVLSASTGIIGVKLPAAEDRRRGAAARRPRSRPSRIAPPRRS